MVKKDRGPPPKKLWAYGYDITLPPEDERVASIQELLDREHAEAIQGARTWASRVVVEPQLTRILVISDSPDSDRGINRRLEAGLKALKAKFVVTVPMLVVDHEPAQALNGRPDRG